MKLFFVFGFVFSALLVHDVQCWWFGFKDVGKSLEDAGTSILDKVPSSVIDAGKSVVDAGSDILDKVPDVNDVTKSITDAGTDLINKVPDAIPSSVKDVSKLVVDAGSGILDKIPDVLPSAEGLIQMGKNVLAGYPFDVAFKIINAFCSAALVSKSVQPRFTPNISSMNFILRFDHKDYLIPLTRPELLWKHDKFNPTWPTVLLATGWKTNYNESENKALDDLYEAYHCRGKINFVTVDSAAFVDTLYSWSAFNTDAIGVKIADALELLIRTYPIENIHLIGHSLGAHIVGSASRTLYERTNKQLKRVTGLDPANPCFGEGKPLPGLARGDAEFVDVIHSNSGALGKRDSIGDVDFYPNGLHPLPPGCVSISCAHMRAYEYFAESVYPGNEQNFMGNKCTSLTALNSQLCPGRRFPMGFAVPRNLKGNLFLTTNEESPYGQNQGKGKKQSCNRVAS